MAAIITPTPGHGNILKRLIERLEVEKKQHKLIMEESLQTAGSGGSKPSKSSPSPLESLYQLILIARYKRRARNSKVALSSTPPQAVDFGKEFDRRISALERDNVELKRDNVELKSTVDRVSASRVIPVHICL
jgi:hypothetical protein